MNGKLSLNLEDLTVDSFSTTDAQKEKGTVFGEQCTCPTQCTCPGCPTCEHTCNATCEVTCAATCANTCDDASCAGTCNFQCYRTYDPCTTNRYTVCDGMDCQ